MPLNTFRKRVMSLLQFNRLPAHKVHCENRPTGEEEAEKELEMENKSLICKLLTQVTYYNRSHLLLKSNNCKKQ